MREVRLVEPPTAVDDPCESAEAKRERIRRKGRLTRAAKNPRLALERGWHHDPKLCAGLLDLTEHQAFICAPDSLALALRMVEITEKNGDPHLHHKSVGVLAYAYMARWDHFWAGKILNLHKPQILACCPDCRSEYFRREGDRLAELRKPDEALVAFRRSVDERRGIFVTDDFGRFCLARSLGFHFRGDRDPALEDLGRTMRHTSLAAPKGFFLDAAAMVGIYVLGGDPCHDRRGLELIEELARRIKGRDETWSIVRTRLLWVKGLLHARLGEIRRARRCLTVAHRQLVKHGLAREAVACSIDLAQLGCRHWDPPERNVESAQKVISRCLKRKDLRAEHEIELTKLRDQVLRKYPYDAFNELGALRLSFVAPVPHRADERIEQA